MKQDTTCALCDTPVSSRCLREDDAAFCCPGCLAVFRILSKRHELDGFQSNPLFRQAVRSGIISNPYLLEKLRSASSTEPSETQRLNLEITDLWCPSCAEVITWVLLQEKGIRHCVVDYSTDLATIEFIPRDISQDRVLELLRSLGYHPVLLQDSVARTVSRTLYLRFVIAAFCAFNSMMFAYPIYASYFEADPQGYGNLFAWMSFVSALPVVTYCAYPLVRRFWGGLRVGVMGMEALVVMGVSAAFGYSVWELLHGGMQVYFDSLTVIIAFVLFGKIIETRAKFSAKESLMSLTRSLPRRGRKILADGREEFVGMKEVYPGDRLVALTGEKVVLDGVVVEGQGSVDESVMTGEAIPVAKMGGSDLLSGTVVTQGRLVYRVTTTPETSLLQQIIGTVERDIGHKSTYVRAADRIAHWFVPVVIGISLVSGVAVWIAGGSSQEALLRAVSVLLISCPCAIGIAAPLAESHLMQGLSRLGAIVRNRGCLQDLGRETAFIFDKTGTVTVGHFTILEGLQDLSEVQKQALRGLVSYSIHPISGAIAQALVDMPAMPFRHVEERPGRGLRGEAPDGQYLLGSVDMMREEGIVLPAITNHDGLEVATTVYFCEGSECVACLILGDQVRPDAPGTISALAPLSTYLISGDAIPAVEMVAKACSFTEWRAGYSPLEKRAFIEALRKKGEVVAMLGDGINDAPALTAAQVGISVVSAADISIQVSDLLLTTDRLIAIPKIRNLAQKGHRIIVQNLFWAFAYNIVGIGLAAAGYLSPIFSAFAMVASSLMVIINANRLR